MSKSISILHLSGIAWKDFCNHWVSWVLLAACGLLCMITTVVVQFYVPEHTELASIVLTLVGAVYTAILHQNGLDAAYGRKLSMMHLSTSILCASLFFIALSMYNPLPQYIEYLVLIFPENFYFLVISNWLIHAVISYLLMRCMFIGMIVLEEKCSFMHAFHKSLAMTQHHVFLLFVVFIYLAIVLMLSALTIVGYFIVLPYTILVKSLLFKQLHENYN